jgi:H/ACA ribonucleoprotein complex non-core subunit NAF1
VPSKVNIKDLDAEDEESGVAAPTATYFQTENEVVEAGIAVPDVEEIGADEILERVGEVMNIIDNKESHRQRCAVRSRYPHV